MDLTIRGGCATSSGFKIFTAETTLRVAQEKSGVMVYQDLKTTSRLAQIIDTAGEKLQYVPLVGSALRLLSVFVSDWETFLYIISPLLLVSYLADRFAPDNFLSKSPIGSIFKIVFLLLVVYYAVRVLPRLLRHHSVEHMTIELLTSGKPVTAESLKSCNPLSINCGSILVMITILLQIFFVFALRWPSSFLVLLSLVLATDIKKAVVAMKIQWILKPFLYLQRAFCWPPRAEDIELGVAIGEQYRLYQSR